MSYSLTTLRQYVMRHKIRGWRSGVTGVWNGSAGVGVVNASNSERQRILMSSSLADQATVGGEESGLGFDKYDNAYVYIPSLGTQRRVPTGGFSGALLASTFTDQSLLTTSYVGALTVSRPYTAVVAANLAFEVSTRLPFQDDMDLAGIHSMINRALNRLMMPSRIAITGVADTERYSLASYPWIKRQDQLIRVLGDESVSTVEPVPMRGSHSIRFQNQVPYLVTTGSPTAGSSFYVDVWRPRGSWISVGGSWSESTAGLVNESDEADVDLDELALLTYYYACDELAEHGASGEMGMWAKRRDDAAAQAAPLLKWERERYDDTADHPVSRRDMFSSISGGGGGVSWP